MAHPPSPTASSTDGPSGGHRLDGMVSPGDEQAIVDELHSVVTGLRARLTWLKQGGIDAAPAPIPRPARPRPSASSPPVGVGKLDPAAVPAHAAARDPRASLTAPPREPAYDSGPGDSDDAAAIARAAVESSSRLATRSPSAAPKAPVRKAASDAPALSSRPSSEVVYPELQAATSGADGLRVIREFIGDCRRCNLCHGRNQIVFGDGNPTPWLAFVGEGPGADEDRTGLPFVGAAGELLSKMIKAMGEHALKLGFPELAEQLSRERVYIANVVKCRPPGNRVPEADEIAACGGFIRAQLTALSPRVIVALGRTPTQFLLANSAPLGRLRGQFGDWQGVAVMPTYHPAYLLRTPSAKAQVWDDLKLVILRLVEQLSASPTGFVPPPHERNP